MLKNEAINFIRYTCISLSILILFFILTLISCEYWGSYFNLDIEELSILSIVMIVCSYTSLLCTKTYKKIGFHMIIMTYTFLCQFGFLIAYKLSPIDSMIRSDYTMRFMYMPEYKDAIQISLIVSIVFVLFTLITLKFSRNRIESYKNNIEMSKNLENIIFYIGILVEIIVSIYLIYLLSKGIGNITYGERVEILSELGLYGHMVVISSFIFCIMLACLPKKKWIIGLTIYSIISILQLSLGNRGEILYSVATCISIYYLRYGKINKLYLYIGIVMVIIIIPVIRDFRATLTVDLSILDIRKSIVEFLSELGFQIAPLTYTVEFLNDGSNYTIGGTYIYSIMDFIARKIPTIGKLPTDTILNIKYIMPQNGLGFSQIAESFYNFGIVGSSIIYMIYANLLIKIECIFTNNKTHIYTRIFISMIVVIFVNLTRNTFVTFPLYFTYSIIIILTFLIVNSVKYNKNIS